MQKMKWHRFPLHPHAPSSSGATYTRWGASKCPKTSDLVYSGIIGGSYYYQRGGGSNYLCLPKERNAVVYSKSLKYKPGVQRYSPIYGTEYENPLNGEDDSNAPCAVCQSTKSNTLMIPGTSKCPDSWLPYVCSCQLLQDHFCVCG